MTWTKTHQPCPCGKSSDAYSLDDAGRGSCFSCGKNFKPERESELTHIIQAIPSRGISLEAAKRFGISSNETEQVYPYHDEKGNHVADKVRTTGDKSFYSRGTISQGRLFGQYLFPSRGRAVSVVEGELDAASAWQLLGKDFPVVSLKNGAAGAVGDCKASFEWLNSFEDIVLCFDNDEPGQLWAERVAQMFEPNKVRILKLQQGKDANEYLQAGLHKQFVHEWWRAPKYTPAGLKLGSQLWDDIVSTATPEAAPYPFQGLNDATYGIRLSELVLIDADTGVGKTSVVKEIEYHLLKHSKWGLGLLHIEESNVDTALGLMSIAGDKPLHLPPVRARTTQTDLETLYRSTVDTDRLVLWDHFGSNSIHEVLAKVRHMVALGCQCIVIDHLSIIVSDQSGDERKQLDEISTKLKTLCMELKIALICVIHTNRQGLIRSSAGPEKLANIRIHLTRDVESSDPWVRNIIKGTMPKNRFCGITGPVLYAQYLPETGRLIELTPEQRKHYLEGTQPEEDWS